MKPDKIIYDLTSYLTVKDFCEIRADLEGYSQPAGISCEDNKQIYIPDLSAVQDEKLYIFDVQAEDTLHTERAKQRWDIFSSHAVKNNAQFVVVVPVMCESEAVSMISDMCLENTMVWAAN